MRFTPSLIALAFACAAAAAPAQDRTPESEQAPLWLQSDNLLLLAKARIAFPARPGGWRGKRGGADAAGPPAAHALLGVFDGGGVEASGPEGAGTSVLGSRVPDSFCRSGDGASGKPGMTVLRWAAAKPEAIDGRTRLIVLLGDAGRMLELAGPPWAAPT